jgi:hypothetical protein
MGFLDTPAPSPRTKEYYFAQAYWAMQLYKYSKTKDDKDMFLALARTWESRANQIKND